MAQRIFNLSKWRHMGDGHSWFFGNPNRRMVALDVNCPEVVHFYAVQDVENLERDPERIQDREAGRDGELAIAPPIPGKARSAFPAGDEGKAVTFIGRAVGRDRLEFGVEGAFELVAIGGEAYVYTHDSEDVATRIIDPVIFTKIANRRDRNPELEWANYQMRLNSERLMRHLEGEMERRIGALERKEERYVERRATRTPLGKPRIERPRASSEVDGEESPERRRSSASETSEDKGGGSRKAHPMASKQRKKITAPPISK